VLLLTQTYPPDPAAVGQHLDDVAVALVDRGHAVHVLASDVGFERTTARYPHQELRNGVDVRRLRWTSFGKASIAQRLAGAWMYNRRAVATAAQLPTPDVVVVATSPPLAPLAALSIARRTGAGVVCWLPDLNPEQAVREGHFAAHSVAVRAFEAINRRVLRGADAIIVLDEVMAATVRARPGADTVADTLAIVPPWAPALEGESPPHAENPWRIALGIGDRRLVMYSGNHSPVHPLTTLADAARELADDRLRFAFVGGGGGKAAVMGALPGALDLPYQPVQTLRQSLAAADVHVVSVGNATVGVVHPSKLYGALAVGRPVLVFGPPNAPASQLVMSLGCGWCVAHGDVAGARRVLEEIATAPDTRLQDMGARAAAAAQGPWSRAHAIGAFCDVVERVASRGASRVASRATATARTRSQAAV
jgi:colanic acid biosynthesis glycosyl transferase WcaI